MADASSIRYTKTNPSASARNRGAIRYNTVSNLPVFSNGYNWSNFVPTYQTTLQAQQVLNADCVNSYIFAATQPCRITGIKEIHATATSVTTSRLQIVKVADGAAISTGTYVLSSGINVAAAINVAQTGTLVTDGNILLLNPGDKLAIVYTGAVTSLAGVAVAVTLEQQSPERIVYAPFDVVTGQNIFIAPIACFVTGIRMIATAGSSGTDATVDIYRETGTTAPGSGATILTTPLAQASTANGLANRVLSGSLAASDTRYLAVGDRLSLKFAGTATNLAGLVIGVELRPVGAYNSYDFAISNSREVNDQISRTIVLADRGIKVAYGAHVASAAGTNGSNVNITLTKDSITSTTPDAPGVGSANTMTGTLDLKATANTVTAGTLSSTVADTVLNVGQRLGIKVTGTPTAVVNSNVTVAYQYL